MGKLHIEIEWRETGPISVGADGTVSFPEIASGAGVYRYVFRLGERSRVYVGETDNFRRRFYGYTKPGPAQSTNQRMNDRFIRLAAEGGSSMLEIASRIEVRVGDQEVSVDINNVFMRRLIENAALVEAMSRGDEIVNGKGFPPGELWDTLDS